MADRRESQAGSLAAGCLIKPSWLSSMSKDEIKIAWKVLEELYTIKTIQFNLKMEINHIDPKEILLEPDIIGDIRLQHFPLTDTEAFIGQDKIECDAILVAAGVWSNKLVDMPDISAKMGVSLKFEGTRQPYFNVWAPYKQELAFNIGNNDIWYGDGTAINEKSWSYDYIKRSTERAAKQGLVNPYRIIVGRRPFVKDNKNGYFKKTNSNVWVSTGGGKNGTILAAYQAYQFLQDIS